MFAGFKDTAIWSPQARPLAKAVQSIAAPSSMLAERWEPSPPPVRASESPSVPTARVARLKKVPWEPSPPPTLGDSRPITPDVKVSAVPSNASRPAWGQAASPSAARSRRESLKSTTSSGPTEQTSPVGSRSPVASTPGSRSPIMSKAMPRRGSIMSVTSSLADTASIASRSQPIKGGNKVIRIGNSTAATPLKGVAAPTQTSPVVVRKTVPAASIGKTQEQRQAEKREKLERRAAEAAAREAAEKPDEVIHEAVTSRVRKQKGKAAVVKPGKSSTATPPPPPPGISAGEEAPDLIATADTPEEQDVPVETAEDAIDALSKEVDLGKYKFFQPFITFAKRYTFTEDELRIGDGLLKGKSGDETEEHVTYTAEELDALQDKLEREFDVREGRLVDLIKEAGRECEAKEQKLASLLAKNRRLAGLTT